MINFDLVGSILLWVLLGVQIFCIIQDRKIYKKAKEAYEGDINGSCEANKRRLEREWDKITLAIQNPMLNEEQKLAFDDFIKKRKEQNSYLLGELNKLRRYFISLVIMFIALISFVFISPIPIRVGDVCLSCWGW